MDDTATAVASPDPLPARPEDAGRPPLDEAQRRALEAEAVAVLKTVFDPEIPVNIYELGMIYGIEVSPDGAIGVRMTLTSPMCPVAGSLPGEVQQRLEKIPEASSARVELVWDPPWDPSCMSEAARLELGMDWQ